MNIGIDLGGSHIAVGLVNNNEIIGRLRKIVNELKNKIMKRVITYGTFDLLHIGHINILKRAKELGDYLIVVLSSDEFNAIKNKKSYFGWSFIWWKNKSNIC